VIGAAALGNGGTLTITFVGTGLDIYQYGNGATADTHTTSVDGTLIGNLTQSPIDKIQKIVSGLPYGTHVVRFTRTTFVNNAIGFGRFLVYGPKKPTLPAGAIELADYNVMATYAANSTVGVLNIGQGVLRKTTTRELTFIGTWDFVGSIDINALTGWGAHTIAVGAFLKYSFFGTGFEIRNEATGSSVPVTISVDGSTNLSGFTVSQYSGGTGGVVPSTGVWTIGNSSAYGVGLSVSNMPLALHTVTLTNNSALNIYVSAFDIITPIHSPRSNIYADLQNTLPVGSQSLSDNRKISMIKEPLPAQKAWAQAVGVVSSPTTSSTSEVPMPDMSLSIKTSGGPVQITGVYSVSHSLASNVMYARIYVDGVPQSNQYSQFLAYAANAVGMMNHNLIVPMSAGVHKIDVYWYTVAGVATLTTLQRVLTAREI
jgi:hypothetical protein